MRISNFVLSLLALVMLSGCAVAPVVHVQVSNFSNLTIPLSNQTISVVGFPEEINSSLEFQSYRQKFERKLIEAGFSLASPDNADFVAFISYGIDTGSEKTELISTPVYGQTGGGTTYTSGTVSLYGGGYGSYSGTSYTMPTFGVVGSSTSSVNYTVYKRQIAMDIVDVSTLDSDEPDKVFEGRLVSSGSCGIMNEVIDELIEAMFSKFPTGSGVVEITAQFDC